MADSQRKTANLFDVSTETNGYYLKKSTLLPVAYDAWNYSDYILLEENQTYNFNPNSNAGNDAAHVFYDVNKQPIGYIDSGEQTFTTPENAVYIRVSYRNDSYDIMLNTGSTALPYEPYWQHSLRKLGTATDTLTTLPSDLYADGTTATVGLVGNMSQTGTPSPSSIIMPSECGERTGNLFAGNNTTIIVGAITLTNNNGNITITGKTTIEIASTNTAWKNALSFVIPAGTYYFAGSSTGGVASYLRNTSDDTRISMPNSSFTLEEDTEVYVGFYLYQNTNNDFNIMLNTGSTPLPYEPYGYKIPILCGGVTTPVYLGEVETTRKIKKYEFTGQEEWARPSSNIFGVGISGYLRRNDYTPICSHYNGQSAVSATSELGDYSCAFLVSSSGNNYFYIRDLNYDAYTDFKTYLQQQYAAGTPVCVWYVLAEPTTGIVNEPLRKIGDYADTVSGITIPTITGKDTFDVLTTLKPSEVSLAYTGWHDAEVKEWDGSEWKGDDTPALLSFSRPESIQPIETTEEPEQEVEDEQSI